jgi:hypothetical protein
VIFVQTTTVFNQQQLMHDNHPVPKVKANHGPRQSARQTFEQVRCQAEQNPLNALISRQTFFFQRQDGRKNPATMVAGSMGTVKKTTGKDPIISSGACSMPGG